MSEWKTPKALSGVVCAALNAGRAFMVQHGEDTGGSPYVTFIVKWEQNEIRITWHTRNTGTYSLFSTMARTGTRDWHAFTVAKAVQMILGQEANAAATLPSTRHIAPQLTNQPSQRLQLGGLPYGGRP